MPKNLTLTVFKLIRMRIVVFNFSLTRILEVVFKPMMTRIHMGFMDFNCVLVRMVSAVFIPLLTRITNLDFKLRLARIKQMVFKYLMTRNKRMVFNLLVTLIYYIFPLNYILMLKLVKCKRLCWFLPQYLHPP